MPAAADPAALTQLEYNGCSLHLQRYPERRGTPLRAWNGADLLLLEWAANSAVEPQRILIVNDDFGALSLALAGSTVWFDSALSRQAICNNAARNQLSPPVLCPMQEFPAGDYQLVLLRIPKQLSLLRYQLQMLREQLPAATAVICGGMDKHLSAGVGDLIAAFGGPTQRHRGERKARLFSVALDPTLRTQEAPGEFYCEQLAASLVSLPNVFSAAQLDGGTRLLLSCFDELPQARRVADLGCGNGVIGLCVMQQNPEAGMLFVDESAMAVNSAQANVGRLFPARLSSCEFRHSDGLLESEAGSLDLVLCNPPFHQQHTVDDQMGKRLLRQSASALADSAELWLVANRHLSYKSTLQRDFARVDILAQDPRFIVWRAVR